MLDDLKSIKQFIDDPTFPIEAKQEIYNLIDLIRRGREDITVFAREILGMQLNPFQEHFLLFTTTPRQQLMDDGKYPIQDPGMLFGKNIAAPSNQIGKTVMIAIKHLYFNFYKIGMTLSPELFGKASYLTLNISPMTRQAKACYNYVEQILNENFVYEWQGVKQVNQLSPVIKGFLVGTNVQLGEMRFANNTTFFTVAVGHDQAASLAGGQFGYISYDECAQSYHLENELGAKILSRLIKYGAALDLISTAEVDSPSHQHYYQLVKKGLKGQDGWWAMTGKLDDNIFISEEQRTRIKADLLSTDKKKYQQVVMGAFVTGGKRFFDQAEIDNLFKMSGRKTLVKGHKYMLVADWGMSDTGDPSVFYVLDYTSYSSGGKIQLVAREKTQGGSPNMQFAILRTLYDEFIDYGDDGYQVIKPIFYMDANALGGVTIKKLLVQLNPKAFDIEKDEALFVLKRELSSGRAFEEDAFGGVTEKNPDFGNVEAFFIQELADQLGMYHVADDKLKQDEVMTLMMGVSTIAKKFPRRGTQTFAKLNPLVNSNVKIKVLNGQATSVKNMFN